MSALFRVRRGLQVLVIGVLATTLIGLGLFVPLRYYHWMSRGTCRILWYLGIYAWDAAPLIVATALVLITYPFGRRSDRFLPRLGVPVLVLAALSVIPIFAGLCLRTTAPSQQALKVVVFGSCLVRHCLLAADVLVWVHLLARVRRRREALLWLTTLSVLLIRFYVLAYGVWRFVTFAMTLGLAPLPVATFAFGDPWGESWPVVWEHQINTIAWIVTMLGVWYYVRKLGSAIQKPG